MPSLNISLSENLVSHPILGDLLLDIQGDLEIDVPTKGGTNEESMKDEEIITFGRLEIDEESKNCVLYVGTKQRLKGKMVKLDPPLALMKFEESAEAQGSEKKVQIVKVIKNKLVFKDRPLPIM